eukprot:239665-Hanusia_phi.AAC.2
MDNVLRNAVRVLPTAVLATDAAYVFGNRWLSLALLGSMMVGSYLRRQWEPPGVQPAFASIDTLARLDVLLLPSVMCVASGWPTYYVGTTIAVISLCLCLRRLPLLDAYVPYIAVALFVPAYLIAFMGLPVQADFNYSVQRPAMGWAGLPCVCLALHLALAPRDCRPRHDWAYMPEWATEVLLMLPYLIWPGSDDVTGDARGLQFALLRIVDTDGSLACRILYFLAAGMVVLLQLQPFDEKKCADRRRARASLEVDALGIAWAAAIFVPLLPFRHTIWLPVYAAVFRSTLLLYIAYATDKEEGYIPAIFKFSGRHREDVAYEEVLSI